LDEDRYFEDYVIGERSTAPGRTITETDLVMFAGQIRDMQAYHVDAEFARTAQYGQRVVYGMLVFSLASGFMARSHDSRLYSYGYDRVRFIKPVFVGDTIRVEIETVEKLPSPKHRDHGFVLQTGTTFNQRDETVLVFTHLGFVERRTAEIESSGPSGGA
jgi:acyl dehydratase